MKKKTCAIKIRELKYHESSLWDDYVKEHPNGTIFHLTKWKNVIEKCFGHKSYYFIALAQNTNEDAKNDSPEIILSQNREVATKIKIVGVFPVFRIQSILFGNYFVSVPFAEIGGPLADNTDIEKDLIVKAESITKKMKSTYMEMRNRDEIKGYKTKDLYYNFRREIHVDLDTNLKLIPKKARRMIRVGEKNGLKYEFQSNDIDAFYELLAKNYHNLGTPVFPKRFFKEFMIEFGDSVKLLIIKNKFGLPISGVLTFFYKDQVLPYYAGSLMEQRNLAPNDFMYWQLMKYGCENGYKYFDFGRSKLDTGSFHFKRHWGFEPCKLSYQYVLLGIDDLPNLSPSNPKYKRKIDLWKKLPFRATKLIGPHISKYLA